MEDGSERSRFSAVSCFYNFERNFMRWILVVAFVVFSAGAYWGLKLVSPEPEVSFSEIENSYRDLNLEDLQKSLQVVQKKIQKSGEQGASYSRLRKEQVVLTKLIIFKKHKDL
jgi:hypothetical protein